MEFEDVQAKREPSPSPPTSHVQDLPAFKGRTSKGCEENSNVKDKMSQPQSQPCTFADVAVSYRVYILDDLLAEPQEIVHDWYRNLLYISQRHRQGNSFAPIELSHEISVFDISVGNVVASVDLAPYAGPHCLELGDSCAYLHAYVNGGNVWIDPDSRTLTNFQPAEKRRRAHRTSEDFIAEIDLRSGKMRQRVNVPEGDRHASDGRHVTFSAPGIRFASRSSSNGFPVLDVTNDPVVEAIKAKFAVRNIYVTSRNVMLV
ncbi:hypothetical protein F4779DRAFT_634548 [Xylariaceae sp. FL0662B]|nr:hypothetical protein F4779DRAFT_634548 [Xylariaceae sp. FL0662B]